MGSAVTSDLAEIFPGTHMGLSPHPPRPTFFWTVGRTMYASLTCSCPPPCESLVGGVCVTVSPAESSTAWNMPRPINLTARSSFRIIHDPEFTCVGTKLSLAGYWRGVGGGFFRIFDKPVFMKQTYGNMYWVANPPRVWRGQPVTDWLAVCDMQGSRAAGHR